MYLLIDWILFFTYIASKSVALIVFFLIFSKNKCLVSLIFSISMLSALAPDFIGFFFATDVYVVEFDLSAKTFAYDLQRYSYIIHYVLILAGSVALLRASLKSR